jgi:hypothetical protein
MVMCSSLTEKGIITKQVILFCVFILHEDSSFRQHEDDVTGKRKPNACRIRKRANLLINPPGSGRVVNLAESGGTFNHSSTGANSLITMKRIFECAI